MLIWMADATKRCDYVNKPWLDFTGRTLEEVVGDGWLAGLHPDDLDRCVAAYTAASTRASRFRWSTACAAPTACTGGSS